MANSDEAKSEYGLDLVELDSLQGFDAVVVAVGHKTYCNLKLDDWQKILKERGVLIDVKSLYPKDTFSESGIRHWRL